MKTPIQKLKKYQLAWSNRSNCTRKDHSYMWLTGETHKAEADEIRKQHPSLTAMICKCIYCGKVTSSM